MYMFFFTNLDGTWRVFLCHHHHHYHHHNYHHHHHHHHNYHHYHQGGEQPQIPTPDGADGVCLRSAKKCGRLQPKSDWVWSHTEVSTHHDHHMLRKIIFRIGLNYGDVTSGVIGNTKLYYDIWGDAVNIASRCLFLRFEKLNWILFFIGWTQPASKAGFKWMNELEMS